MKTLVLGDGILGSEIVKQTGWESMSRKKTGFDINSTSLEVLNDYDIVINCIANTDCYSLSKIKHVPIRISKLVTLKVSLVCKEKKRRSCF